MQATLTIRMIAPPLNYHYKGIFPALHLVGKKIQVESAGISSFFFLSDLIVFF
jgi:hypothetical protein